MCTTVFYLKIQTLNEHTKRTKDIEIYCEFKMFPISMEIQIELFQLANK